MKKTRLSFLYLISYLVFGGIALIAAPATTARLFQSNVDYPVELLRLTGGFMLALAAIVTQIRKHQVEVLYSTTLAVRVVLLAILIWGYASSANPLFMVLSAIVALGILFTGLGLLSDRKAA